jgi:glycosyltransferase involved in cell wall biosynthesis
MSDSMRILQINSVYGVGSTGRIVKDISELLIEKGYESYVAYGCGTVHAANIYRMESKFYQKINILKTRMFGKHGFYNKIATCKLIRWIDTVNPDVIHLHNIHGHYINIEILFKYLKKIDKPIIWTLHDCWSFTGHCSHFDYVQCDKWKMGCFDCPQKREYPDSWIFDRSKIAWRSKKKLITDLDKIMIITPSRWLSELVKQSFLKKYPVQVVSNGIELQVFEPKKGNILKENGLDNKKVVLCVAGQWNERKGLFLLNELSKKIHSDYRLVVVGVEKKQDKNLNDNIITIYKTNNINELAELYSRADFFVNLTLEDNFPTVNLEALACGTPVITFETGGSPESINEKCGKIVEKGNVDAIVEAINEMEGNDYTEECIKQAENYDKKERFSEYINLYNECGL